MSTMVKVGVTITANLNKVKAGGRVLPGDAEWKRLKQEHEERDAAVDVTVPWQSCRLTGEVGKQGKLKVSIHETANFLPLLFFIKYLAVGEQNKIGSELGTKK